MKSYNGFSAEQRARAQAWLNSEWKSGRLPRPASCCACGRAAADSRGMVFDAHAEDYSEPFGLQTQEFHLCFSCHMALHCRFGKDASWTDYRAAVAAGNASPYVAGRNFPLFVGLFAGGWEPMLCPGAPVRRDVLAEIVESGRLFREPAPIRRRSETPPDRRSP